MRILFHAPGLVAFRPESALPHLLGVQPVIAPTLEGLRANHRLTGNRGNLIHAEAPAKSIAHHPTGSAYGNVARLRAALGPAYAETLASQFDILVISMANFIRPDHDGTALFTALKALDGRLPFVVLGAGLQGSHPLDAMMPGNRNLLAIMNERASLLGVRGELTAAWMQANGFGNATVLGCPSLYVFPRSILELDAGAARMRGARADVMTAGHLSLHGGKIIPRGRQLARALAGVRASYVFQDEFVNYGPMAKVAFNEATNSLPGAGLNAWMSEKSERKINFERYYYFTESGAWRQAALRHDVFIGDRFHGGVAALQAGLPAIFLKHDNRVSELTGHFDLPALPIAEFVEQGLARTIAQLLSDERLTAMKTRYRQRHGEYAAALAGVGLQLTSELPAADPDATEAATGTDTP